MHEFAAGDGAGQFSPADAEALVVTYLLNNDGWTSPRAAAWEAKVAALLQTLDPSAEKSGGWKEDLRVSYSLERAVEDEIARGARLLDRDDCVSRSKCMESTMAFRLFCVEACVACRSARPLTGFIYGQEGALTSSPWR